MAENGQIAIDMAHGGDYELVLMDMQTPVMDGLAATSSIRQIPGWHVKQIVALTAISFGESSRGMPERWHERLSAQAGRSAGALRQAS